MEGSSRTNLNCPARLCQTRPTRQRSTPDHNSNLIGFFSRNYGSLDFCINAPDYSVSSVEQQIGYLIGFNKTLAPQIRENDASIFFRGVGDCFQCDLGMLGWLVRIINAGKVFDLAQSRLGVKAFGIPPFAFFQGSINENLHETINSDHASN